MGKKYTTKEYIEKAKIVHGDKYDYSLVKYNGSKLKIDIICPEHGVFRQDAYSHLMGHGCSKMGHGNELTLNFIEKSKKVHCNKFDYSRVKYTKNHIKVEIICKIHGIFMQTPNEHLNKKCGCPKCSNKNVTTEEFIEKAKKIHGNKYDYSLVVYKGNRTHVKIICPIHGVYNQLPITHLHGSNCAKCSGTYMDINYFIEKSNKIHENKYDYILVDYINIIKKVKIICPIHGGFMQSPRNHICGAGCKKCSGVYMDTEYFIEKSNIIHNNKYDYSLVKYAGSLKKVEIGCLKHGIFKQIPSDHLRGHGCPNCVESKGELVIAKFLIDNNISYTREKKFDDCKNVNKLPFDFYIPDYKLLIEYDGEQHFKPINYFGGDKVFKQSQFNDNIKNIYAKNNNINLLRIKFDEFNNINKILNNTLQI